PPSPPRRAPAPAERGWKREEAGQGSYWMSRSGSRSPPRAARSQAPLDPPLPRRAPAAEAPPPAQGVRTPPRAPPEAAPFPAPTPSRRRLQLRDPRRQRIEQHRPRRAQRLHVARADQEA